MRTEVRANPRRKPHGRVASLSFRRGLQPAVTRRSNCISTTGERDMALHRIIDNGLPPSEDAWADTTEWVVQSSSSRTIRLLNTDGSFTVLHGVGFAFDGTGEPSGGRVLSLERVSADGTTVLERLDLVNVSLSDLRTAFDAGGFVQTLLGGNDVVIGTDNSRFVTADTFQETFYTGAGNDIVFGGGGADLYIDGAGS